MYMNGIGKSRLTALTKHYKEYSASPRDFFYEGRNSKAVTFEQAKQIVDFLLSFSRYTICAIRTSPDHSTLKRLVNVVFLEYATQLY